MALTDQDVLIFLIGMIVVIIPVCLFTIIVLTKELNNTIKKCDDIGNWAKEESNKLNKDNKEEGETKP